MDAAARADVAIMELFYSSGLRLSELAALDVGDVDPYTESVRVFGKGRKGASMPCRSAGAGGDLRVIGLRRTHSGSSPIRKQSAKTNVDALQFGLVLKRYFPRYPHPFRFRSVPINCAIASRPICSIAVPTCAACRRYSARQSFHDTNLYTHAWPSNGSRKRHTDAHPRA